MVVDRLAFASCLRCVVRTHLVCRSTCNLSSFTSDVGNLLAEKKSEPSFGELTQIAIEAALLAGSILRHGFGTHFQIKSKEGHHNLVTEYDHKAERAIIDFIQKNAPDSQFLAEESGVTGNKSSLVWIIDPLDGTVNFAHQIPLFAVSIGVEKSGKMIAGVDFQPITEELFVAE